MTKCFFCVLNKPFKRQVKLTSKPKHEKLQEKYATISDVFIAFASYCRTHKIDVGRGEPGVICKDCIQLLELFVITHDELMDIVEGGGHQSLKYQQDSHFEQV